VGSGPDENRRVLRGGSWNNEPENMRSANRNRNDTDNRNDNIGFRLAQAARRPGAAAFKDAAGAVRGCP
jgi:formylglycine-generating enzyme required for sulfatase activity